MNVVAHLVCRQLVVASRSKQSNRLRLGVQRGRAFASTSDWKGSDFAALMQGGKVEVSSLRQLMLETVKAKRDRGEFVPANTTRMLCELFYTLDERGKESFFKVMAHELGTVQTDIITAAQTLVNMKERDPMAIYHAQQHLHKALTPLHSSLFTHIIAQPNGMKVLVDMRRDLLVTLKNMKDDTKLKALEENLRQHLQHWFSVGFLNLERITWQSPALLLEKIKGYSASVHPVKTWDDLKLRLGRAKRCYGFFHPSMPLEPLVFIEVALVKGIAAKIAPIFSTEQVSEYEADTAIFYAITSTQDGLSGVDLGQLLIKRVVKELQAEFPNLHTFSTLSPIPTFRPWLESRLALELQPEGDKFARGSREPLLYPNEEHPIQEAAKILGIKAHNSHSRTAHLLDEILKAPWQSNAHICSLLEPTMTRICARYLVQEKKRGLALDPVANFHVRNGAEVHRINWLGDLGEKRMKQSYGFMVNYLYKLEDVEKNNERYLFDGTVAVSQAVGRLLPTFVSVGAPAKL